MKAIVTKYHGPGNSRGSRYSASDEDGNKIFKPADYRLNSEDNHREAARRLCEKMGWAGDLVGGGIKEGYAWVFLGGIALSIVRPQCEVCGGMPCREGCRRAS